MMVFACCAGLFARTGVWVMHPNKMAGKKEIRNLSDFELLTELKSLGLKIGPISPTTRRIYEKKLSRARGCDVVDSTFETQDKRRNAGERACTLTDSTNDSTNFTSGILESPAIFYGVCYDVVRPASEGGLPNVPVVFTSKEEALKTAKKFKGARFKGFKTRVEAEGFSRSRSREQENSPAVTSSLSSPTDPVSSFKGPTPQELVKFRNVIELGSREEFLDIVLGNPRYLIGPGDTPVILQEGFRYNAIHVAVKNDRRDMCQLIIDTLESQQFWNILLNQDNQSAINSQRRHFLVDMYLNTPDKGNLETPLHFACKYGHTEVVEYLVSHPLTDIHRTNKYGETPAQVICSRCSASSSEIKSQIESYLEDNVFVPLLGSLDSSTPPWIGDPWSPEVTEEKSPRSSFDNLKQKNSPGDLPLTVRAYAGPMSPSKAEEFFYSWKTPPKAEQRNSYIQIKRKDDSRGVERIGRELAHNGKIPWTEYWDFLECFADLSSSHGLEKLEDYLAKRKDRILLSRLSVTPQRVGVLKGSGSTVLKTPESRQSSVILGANGLPRKTGGVRDYHCDESSDMDFSDGHHLSSRKTLFSNSVETGNDSMKVEEDMLPDPRETSSMVDVSNYSSLLNQTSDVVSHEPPEAALATALDLLSLQGEQDGSEALLDVPLNETPRKQDLLNAGCIEARDGKGVLDDSDALPCKKKLSYRIPDNNGTPFEAEGYNASVAVAMETDTQIRTNLAEDNIDVEQNNSPQNIANEIPSSSQEDNCPVGDLTKSCCDDEVFENTQGGDSRSAKKDCTDSGNVGAKDFKLPIETNFRHAKSESCSHVLGLGNEDVSIFIQGLQPSKLDLDVLIAIGQTNIDSRRYPSIAQWKQVVMSYSADKQQSWPSPGSPRYNLTRHKSLMWSC